jgi:dolichyl-phosphate-mannose-protein mannosyltransferase
MTRQPRPRDDKQRAKKLAGPFRRWPVVAVAIVIIFFSLVRFRLRNMPLERDEGEYAYVGQLMLQGIAPYELAYNMKLPGTYAAYALMMAVFGQTPAGIHLGLIVVNAATVVLVFLLARRLFDELAGVTAAASYALLSTSEAVLGFAGHATHFVVLATLGGIILLLKAIETQRTRFYFLAGFLLGLAFVIKQPGFAFTAFGGLYLIVKEWRRARDWQSARQLASYGAGAVLPFALTCLTLFLAGDLGRMWFWTISYARQYASVTRVWSGSENLFVMGSWVIEPHFLLWMLAVLGVAALLWDSTLLKHAGFTIAFLLFSWVSVCAGFYFRPHYFILVLPAVSILTGVAVSSATRELAALSHNSLLAALPAAAFLVLLAISIAGESDLFFRLDPVAACRQVYGRTSPFPEAEVIAERLKQQTPEAARIAVLGSEPEIYFYARRHSATGYIYTYPFFEPQAYALAMQKEMIREIEQNHPEYLVFVKVPTSWQIRPASNTFILDWFQKYSEENYEIVGVADETTPDTNYVWGDAARTYQQQGKCSLRVFKRKGT